MGATSSHPAMAVTFLIAVSVQEKTNLSKNEDPYHILRRQADSHT